MRPSVDDIFSEFGEDLDAIDNQIRKQDSMCEQATQGMRSARIQTQLRQGRIACCTESALLKGQVAHLTQTRANLEAEKQLLYTAMQSLTAKLDELVQIKVGLEQALMAFSVVILIDWYLQNRNRSLEEADAARQVTDAQMRAVIIDKLYVCTCGC